MILGAGVDLNVKIDKDVQQSWQVGNMTTMSFHPSKAFLEEAVQHDDVRSYITGTWFREKIYMITGVMVAVSSTSFRESLEERGLYIHAGVDATAWTGVPISVGPEGKWKRKTRVSEESQRDEEFVFAYRVREIRVRKKGGVKADRSYDKGALFNADKKRSVKGAEEVELIGLNEDADAGDSELETKEVVQDLGGGEEAQCVCALPELQ